MSNKAIATAVVFFAVLSLYAKHSFEEQGDSHVFMRAVDGLSEQQTDKFFLGKSFFRIPWVEAPSATTARDGLGPLFNANTCVSCHPHNGTGSVYNSDGQISRSFVVRLSVNGKTNPIDGFVADPVYGGQLNINGIKDVPFEGRPILSYESKTQIYPDGQQVVLRKPILKITDLNYGPLSKDIVLSARLAPSLVGMGLLEKISDKQILTQEDLYDKDKDGISGKANMVYDRESRGLKVGRFTWKASAPNLKQQTASALFNDMGLTNPLYSSKNCTEYQKECLQAPKGRDKLDVTADRLEAISFYIANLKVPVSGSQKDGRKLFSQIGCAKCHKESYNVGGIKIEPFSDLLLHDMGDELADGRTEFLANGNEWRTPPLWGIGSRTIKLKQTDYLHDGRARSIEEAILWHGGEAMSIKEKFKALDKNSRKKIIDFLEKL